MVLCSLHTKVHNTFWARTNVRDRENATRKMEKQTSVPKVLGLDTSVKQVQKTHGHVGMSTFW